MELTQRWTALMIFVLFLSALTLRIFAVEHTQVVSPLRADAGDYASYAFNLRTFGVYSRQPDAQTETISPDAVRSPGYPLLLLPFLEGSKLNIHALLLFQCFIGAITVVAGFLLARRFLPVAPSLFAGLFIAASPHLTSMSTYVLTETLFCFLLTAATLSITLAYQHNRLSLWVFAGALMGASALVRPIVQYFFLLLPVLLWVHSDRSSLRRQSLAFAVGFLLLFAWWPLRNWLTLGQMSDPTLMINFLHHGLYPGFTYEGHPGSFGFPYHFDPRAAEISVSVSTALGEIWRRFTEDFTGYAHWVFIGKPITFWSPDIINGAGGIFVYPVQASPYLAGGNPLFLATASLMRIFHWIMAVMALAGSIFVWLPSAGKYLTRDSVFAARLIVFVLLYFTGLHIIGAPFPRYSIPLQPLLYIIAMLLPVLIYHSFVKDQDAANPTKNS